MEKKRTIVNFIRLIVCGAVLAFCAFSLFVKVFVENSHIRTYDISDGWTLEYNGKRYTDVSLNDFRTNHSFERGDELIIKRTLPDGIPRHPGLRLYTEQAEVRVYIDGVKIYTYGLERFQENRYIGGGYSFIKLPVDCAGKQLKIVVISAERMSSNSLPKVVVTEVGEMYSYFMAENIRNIYLGLFTLLLGLVLLVISLAFSEMNDSYRVLTSIGLFSMTISLWALCYAKVFQLFGLSLTANSTLEYLAIYCLPFPYLFLMGAVRRELPVDRRRNLHNLGRISAIFLATVLFFHLTNYAHLSRFITIYHALAVIVFVSAVITVYKPLRMQSIPEKIFSISLLILFGTGISELIRYQLQHRFPNARFLQATYFPVGVMIFVGGTLIAFFMNLFRRVVSEQEVKTLEELTYTDSLTGISNRSMANRRFDEIDEKKTDLYAVCYFDLNGLKKANDNHGHEAGDELIKAFARALKEGFSGTGEVFRMGGDEFLAIVTEENVENVDKAMAKTLSLSEEASKDTCVPVDASYGIAYSREFDSPTVEEVSRLADSRMYEMKKASGKGRSRA